MVIRALVRARLLGMQILTLEAHVVVGADDGPSAIVPPLTVSPSEPGSLSPQSPRPRLASADSVPGVARALELLEQSTEALHRSQRSR
jgi:hypothetical protein